MTTNAHTSEHPTGPDLARVALRAAQEAARKKGGTTESKSPRRRSHQARHAADGRDPKSFDSVVEALITERGWEAPAAGGNAVELWPSIAGKDLAKHVEAVEFRSDTHELAIHSDSPAWLTQLRLERPELLKRFRKVLGPDIVRDIVLSKPDRRAAPASMPATGETPVSQSEAPVITRQKPSEGYLQALAAYQETRDLLPAEKAASEHAPSATLREPVEVFARELARTAPIPSAGANTHAQALARARRERATHANPDTPARTNRKGAPRA
ncbi:DUF721 domain-containing protein [Streptomyces noursei]|uniref:DUF721 domain-containing protein n=1 Tax=Streptomyces noursei TaxID=1971 RepID=UPI0035D657A2